MREASGLPEAARRKLLMCTAPAVGKDPYKAIREAVFIESVSFSSTISSPASPGGGGRTGVLRDSFGVGFPARVAAEEDTESGGALRWGSSATQDSERSPNERRGGGGASSRWSAESQTGWSHTRAPTVRVDSIALSSVSSDSISGTTIARRGSANGGAALTTLHGDGGFNVSDETAQSDPLRMSSSVQTSPPLTAREEESEQVRRTAV